MNNTYKLVKWKLEVTDNRIIFTSKDKKLESFTIKIEDVESIDTHKISFSNYWIRFITKSDKIYSIENIIPKVWEQIKNSVESNSNKINNIDSNFSNTTKNDKSIEKPIIKKETSEQDKIKTRNIIMWIIIFLVTSLWFNNSILSSIFLLAPFYWIWDHKTLKSKNENFTNRLKEYKNHKLRIIASVLYWLFLLASFIAKIEVANEKSPELNVNWWESINLNYWTSYNLNLNTNNTKKLFINDKEVNLTWNTYSQNFVLDNITWLNISIKWLNETKTTTKNILVTRQLTTWEALIIEGNRKKQEAAIAEQKRIEDERAKQEAAYKASPEYKIDQLLKNKKSDMAVYCKDNVREMLKAPSTAKFPNYIDFTYAKWVDNTINVIWYVDSQNSFWAQIRTHYKCIMKPAWEDSAQLIDIKFDQ